jgi:hypothetical protein
MKKSIICSIVSIKKAVVGSAIILLVSCIYFQSYANAAAYVMSVRKIGNDDSYLVEKVCIDGYVYINMYQKKPVMTIQYGTSTALTKFPVLQSTTQSLLDRGGKLMPEKCTNKR